MRPISDFNIFKLRVEVKFVGLFLTVVVLNGKKENYGT